MGKKIYVIDANDIPDDFDGYIDDLTDEEFIEISQDWCFDSIEGFIDAFNADSDSAPIPNTHYLRLI